MFILVRSVMNHNWHRRYATNWLKSFKFLGDLRTMAYYRRTLSDGCTLINCFKQSVTPGHVLHSVHDCTARCWRFNVRWKQRVTRHHAVHYYYHHRPGMKECDLKCMHVACIISVFDVEYIERLFFEPWLITHNNCTSIDGQVHVGTLDGFTGYCFSGPCLMVAMWSTEVGLYTAYSYSCCAATAADLRAGSLINSSIGYCMMQVGDACYCLSRCARLVAHVRITHRGLITTYISHLSEVQNKRGHQRYNRNFQLLFMGIMIPLFIHFYWCVYITFKAEKR